MLDYLIKAGKIALSRNADQEKRNFILGCIGVRDDGTEVSAQNGAVIASSFEAYRIVGDAHAEARALKKMDLGGVLYVARVLKRDGSYAMARCCQGCMFKVACKQINRVYYTIDNNHYGIFYPRSKTDKIIEC